MKKEYYLLNVINEINTIKGKKTVMNKSTQTKQTTMFGTYAFPSYEEIMDAYAKEFENYILVADKLVKEREWHKLIFSEKFWENQQRKLAEVLKWLQ